MHVDFSKNYFDLFGLAEKFDIDNAQLVSRFQELQKQLHPDKYASKPDAERRWSMQAASFVNEAYQTLGDDLKRAIYLLGLHGVSIDEETDTQMSPMFLMEQMEYREALEMAPDASDPYQALDAVRKNLKSATSDQLAAFENACNQQSWSEARTSVRQWQFLDKLKQEVRSAEERLDE